MRTATFKKFNNFILFPDTANKFLVASKKNIFFGNFSNIYLQYIFRQKTAYGYIALKSLLMLGSVFSKRCLTQSNLVVLKYSKTQCHSIVYMPLNLKEYVSVMQFYNKRPSSMNTALTAYINETKYFIFPGFVKILRLPSWKRSINISLKNNQNYWLFFYKTAFLD